MYEGTVGGIAPPPLQLVCETLARPIVEGGAARTITLASFEALGGSEAILGGYLDQVLLRLPDAQQPTARTLLGELVGGSRLKQRLPLDQLARSVNVAPDEADAILDFLCENGIVRRYEGGTISYELTHDFLIGHIVRWLDETFWLVQEARDIVREGVREWSEREGLLPPGKLRRVAAQRERLRLSAPEAAMLYAAAVGYGGEPALWEPLLDLPTRRAVLLTLLRQPEATISRLAAPALATIADADAGRALAESAIAHPDAGVRIASSEALVAATLADPALLDAALPPLLAARETAATAVAASAVLLRLRDRNPATHERLPAALRGPLHRAVWRLRLRRGWPQLLATTLQGLQGGFWGLGLGMGLFLGLYTATREMAWPFIRIGPLLGLVLTGLSLAGLLGAMALGSGAAIGALVETLQDNDNQRRNWLLKSGTSTFFFVLGFLLLALVTLGEDNLPRLALAGLLIGASLTGVATLPMTLSAPLHLLLTVLATVAAFFLANQLGLLFPQGTGWALLMGVAAGIGGFLGFQQSVWRALWRRVVGD